MTPQPIVVGVDASNNARAALAWAYAYAAAGGRPLVVVHALGLLEAAANSRAEVTAAYEDVIAPLDGDVSFVLCDGEPMDVVLREADERDAALVVVGRRGEGAVGAATLGSTSTQVVERCTRPVVVVPAQ